MPPYAAWQSSQTPQAPLPQQRPTCTNMRIRCVADAHKIFYAIHSNPAGPLKMVTRRLDADERAALTSGCVYAWEERSSSADVTGIGIERFTEGKRWSASRVRDEFLFYYEKYMPPLDPSGGSSANTSKNAIPPVDWEQLVKQTYSVFVETNRGTKKWHLTAYFTQSTVDQLGTVDDLAGVGDAIVPPNLFSSTRIGRRRPADAEGITHPHPHQTVQRVYAPFPSTAHGLPIAPRPAPASSASSSSSGSSSGSGIRMYDPYASHRQAEQPVVVRLDTEPAYLQQQPQGYPYTAPTQSTPTPYYSPAGQHFPYGYPYAHFHPPPPMPVRSEAQPQPQQSELPDSPVSPSATTLQPAWEVHPGQQLSSRNTHNNIHSPRSEYSGSSGSASASGRSSRAGRRNGSRSPPYPLATTTHYPLYSAGPDAPIPSAYSSPRSLASLSIDREREHVPSPTTPACAYPPSRAQERDAPQLAPLNSLLRPHPYRREPGDESALRMFGDPDSG